MTTQLTPVPMELIVVNFVLCSSKQIGNLQKDFQNGGLFDMRSNLLSHIRIQGSWAEKVRELAWNRFLCTCLHCCSFLIWMK